MESDSSVSTQDLGVADSVVMASAAAAGVGSGVNFTCINGSGELLENNSSSPECPTMGSYGDNDALIYEPSLGIVVLLSICYGVISLGAVVGNALVIYMVVWSRRMRTITNFFIANLALADFVIGMFYIPFHFQAALLQRWNLPYFMCALCPFFQNVSVNTSIFTLVAIAQDRYRAIVHPLRGKSSKKATKIRIVFIWGFSILLAIPQLIAFRVQLIADGNHVVPQCLPVNIPWEYLMWYIFALNFVQYFLPLGLISYAYIRIGLVLWGNRVPGEQDQRRDDRILRNKKKAVKVLMFVVVIFTVCWLPLQTYQVLSVIAPQVNNFKYINIVWFCSHWLAMSNSCMNPFIYFFCHDKFKQELQNHFRCCLKARLQRGRNRRNSSLTDLTEARLDRTAVVKNGIQISPGGGMRIPAEASTTSTAVKIKYEAGAGGGGGEVLIGTVGDRGGHAAVVGDGKETGRECKTCGGIFCACSHPADTRNLSDISPIWAEERSITITSKKAQQEGWL